MSGMPLPAVLALVFAALFAVALLALGSLRQQSRRQDLADRIERYGPRHASAALDGDTKAAGAALGRMAQLLRSSNTERGLAERLDLAGIARKPAEWALLGVSACAVLSALLTLLLGNIVIGVLAGVAVGYAGMRLILSVRISRRLNAFRDQLPDVLQLVASSLRSGLSLPQALDAVVREDSQPAAGEFSRALAEARIGASVEDALDAVAVRMDSVDLRWTVMAIRIQREVGGNLAEVLSQTVATMRERASLRRHVRALSAEGRLSGYVLIALPLTLAAWLFLTDRSYLRPLWTTPLGVLLVIVAAVLFVIGVIWMRAAVKVEV
jgi:Flp pilus assembly protein TadB